MTTLLYDLVAALAVSLGVDLMPAETPYYAAALQRIAAREWVYGAHHNAAQLRAAIIDAEAWPHLGEIERFGVERYETWARREALRIYCDYPPVVRGASLPGRVYDALMCDVQREYRAWDALDDVVMYGRQLGNVYKARAALNRLREIIGDEAFYKGEMP